MRDIRVFTDQPLTPDTEIVLEDNIAHHLTVVLRLKAGTGIVLFNGTGGEYHAILGQVTGKQTRVLITGFTETSRESPLYISLGIGLSRGDRMDWVIQKATEVGVAEITPLFTARSEVRLKGDRADKKNRHWRKIAINACEQCYRNIPPIINAPTSPDLWFQSLATDKKLVLHHRSEKTVTDLRNQQVNSTALLIGPEGGLTDAEISSSLHSGFEPLTIGPRVFRTETAPIVAITLLQSLWGDFS
ncbi:MAG: 16S rRNA (uracil1498-N3)-methyltransferase [Porticoccus sp.]|jgi:16S rRNA (uracil1498-N3)-methyltransferase|uniref:16S rRNA (uracil(1498)-N(3))-methyltransferase n=1 Tax=Porticoccus sp. TaxID=2024853 RepID=UPI0039E64588|tara:strand:+ start:60474 stop:61208 length:735 start_codon:yes stop_codon:yes gene_type:complete